MFLYTGKDKVQYENDGEYKFSGTDFYLKNKLSTRIRLDIEFFIRKDLKAPHLDF